MLYGRLFCTQRGVQATAGAQFVFANQCFTRYNTPLTTKRAGTNRPFFLVECFWSSKLSGKSLRGLSGFLFWIDANKNARRVLLWDGPLAWFWVASVVLFFRN